MIRKIISRLLFGVPDDKVYICKNCDKQLKHSKMHDVFYHVDTKTYWCEGDKGTYAEVVNAY